MLREGEVWKQEEGIGYLALSNSFLTSGMCSGKERSGSRRRELDVSASFTSNVCVDVQRTTLSSSSPLHNGFDSFREDTELHSEKFSLNSCYKNNYEKASLNS
jgi:hypothetical protein